MIVSTGFCVNVLRKSGTLAVYTRRNLYGLRKHIVLVTKTSVTKPAPQIYYLGCGLIATRPLFCFNINSLLIKYPVLDSLSLSNPCEL